jgi:hypothetical protein
MERGEQFEQEPLGPLEDLDLTGDDADRVTGGDGKQPYVTYKLTDANITSVSTSPPPQH